MSVVFFHRANDFTGSTRALANLIESGYAAENVKVVSINHHGKGFLSNLPNVTIVKVSYPRFLGKKVPLLSYCISMVHQFLLGLRFSFTYDTFYVNTVTPYPAMIAARLTFRNLTVHVHEKFVTLSWENKLCEWLLRNLTCKRVFVSKYVLESYGFVQDDDNSVQYNRLPQSFLQHVKLQSASRIPTRITMLSSYTKAKGIYIFVELARRLPQYQFKLVLSAEEGEYKEDFSDKLFPNLVVLPVQQDVHSILAETDLILNLSIPELWIETFGLTILEGMAYHLPAIVPNVGGPIELVRDGVNGFCVDVTNTEEIMEKIQIVLDPINYGGFVERSKQQLNKIQS